jgi:hypothetical protein
VKTIPDRRCTPRLSVAKRLLPVISHHFDVASSKHPHGAALDLWPIVEEGLFGYELIPDRETRTYLILGRNARDQPCLRTTSYGVDDPDALRLATAGGLLVSPGERGGRFSVQRRDEVFSELS